MICYFAFGAGLGHATRAAAIGQYLDDVTVIRDLAVFNEPLDALGVRYVALDGKTPEAAMQAFEPDLVVWDAPPMDIPADVYLWRHGRPPDLFGRVNVSIDWPCPDGFTDMWPVLVKPEFPSRVEARERLAVADDAELILAVNSAADPGWITEQFDDYPHAVVWNRWPAWPILPGADLVLGAAGCNLWSEVHHLGLTARWVAIRPDQELRIAAGPPPVGVADHAAALASLITTARNG